MLTKEEGTLDSTRIGRATQGREEEESQGKRGEAMYALARELGKRLQVANIPEAIDFCRGRTDNEAKLIASSESVSRL